MVDVFISYCQKDRIYADNIDLYFKDKGIRLHRDIRDISSWKSIREYMQSIRDMDYAILIITDNYLKSLNCMNEALEIMKERKFPDKIFPVVVEKKIYNSFGRIEYINHWQEAFKKLDGVRSEIKEPLNASSIMTDVGIMREISAKIDDFLVMVAGMNNPDVSDINVSIENKLKEQGLLCGEQEREAIEKNDIDIFSKLDQPKISSEETYCLGLVTPLQGSIEKLKEVIRGLLKIISSDIVSVFLKVEPDIWVLAYEYPRIKIEKNSNNILIDEIICANGTAIEEIANLNIEGMTQCCTSKYFQEKELTSGQKMTELSQTAWKMKNMQGFKVILGNDDEEIVVFECINIEEDDADNISQAVEYLAQINVVETLKRFTYEYKKENVKDEQCLSRVVLFCDITNYSIIANRYMKLKNPKSLQGMFEAFCKAVYANGGRVESFTGDGIMGVWDDQAISKSLNAATKIVEEFSRRKELWKETSKIPAMDDVFCRVALGTGRDSDLPIKINKGYGELRYVSFGEAANEACVLCDYAPRNRNCIVVTGNFADASKFARMSAVYTHLRELVWSKNGYKSKIEQDDNIKETKLVRYGLEKVFEYKRFKI